MREDYTAGMEAKLSKFAYTLFLGLILALFVGMGINTFYASPKMPEYPHSLTTAGLKSPDGAIPEEDIQAQRDYDEAYKEYDKQSQIYHRNVSIIALVTAVLFVAVSLVYERKNQVIMNGVMIGGIFILVYSIGRGIASNDTKYTFIAVAVSLAVVLVLGYRRFSDVSAAKKLAKRKK